MSKHISPSDNPADSAAADLIRHKLDALYTDEPSAREELEDASSATHRSKHQKFMYELSLSGRSLADIQTAWHTYYIALPDHEKHQVWQEFYEEHNRRQHKPAPMPVPALPTPSTGNVHVSSHQPEEVRTVKDIKQQLVHKVNARAKRKKANHLKSLAFGLSTGLIVVVILLFGFFNERFIAPFITPSRTVSDSSIIIDPNSSPAGRESQIIIPKINVQIPVVYSVSSIDNDVIYEALNSGAVHYPTTSKPGETGNGAIFGHSSNNILNKGKYKFAFVLLGSLREGDTFILDKDGKRYVYRVFSKKIVKPTEVGVLNEDYGKPATFSLITCDPPGTNVNRLVVTGEQISPDPGANIASSAQKSETTPAILPSNSETLWARFKRWMTS